MKLTTSLMLLLITTIAIQAQDVLKPQFVVTIPGTLGTNSSSVVWHAPLKRYYTALIGNSQFPIISFDANGKRIKELGETGIDLRGMWYNKKLNTLQFNAYEGKGLGYFTLSKTGAIVSITEQENEITPTAKKGVGTLDTQLNYILFLNSTGDIEMYNSANGSQVYSINHLYFGCTNYVESSLILENELENRANNRNKTQIMYTGITKQELAILDMSTLKIELYNKATGLVTKTLQLPASAIAYDIYNVCYNNGYWWLFNTANRTWTAYK